MSDDKKEARAIIMARRQFFITSALAGVALSCDPKGPDDLPPHVCLEMVAPPEPPPPEPAMTVSGSPPPPSSSGSASAAPSAPAPPPPPPPPPAPEVCLEMPEPEPRVCLNLRNEFGDDKKRG